MGLFSNMLGFGRPGPGVRPDEPRKKGFFRLMEIWGRDLGSFFKAGFLAFLGLLPFLVLLMLALDSHALIFVLAAGILGGMVAMPQVVGTADTMLRSLRDEPGYWWVTYRRAWKRNLKGCLLPGAVFGLLLAMQVFMLFHISLTESFGSWVAVLVGFVLTLGLLNYVVAQLALLDLPFLMLLKNSILLFLGYFPRSFGALAVQGLYWGAYLLFYPLSLMILPFTNFWLPQSIAMLMLYAPLEKSFDIENTIKKMRDAELEGPGEEQT